MAVGTLAAIGMGTQLVSAGMSFAQSAQQKKAQKQAELDAKRYIQETKKKLGVNEFDALAIQKEPYELEREALLSQGATATQAAREGEQRGVAATAGMINQSQNQAQAGVRTAMGTDMLNLDIMSATQDQKNAESLARLAQQQAAGAQGAAADAQTASAQAMMGGFQGLTGAIGTGLEMMPLYQKGKSGNAAQDIAGMIASGDVDKSIITGQLGLGPDTSIDDIQLAISGLSPDQLKNLKFSNTLSGAQSLGTQGITAPAAPPNITNPFAVDYRSMSSGQ